MGTRKTTVAVMLIGIAVVSVLASKLHTEYESVSYRMQVLMLGSLTLGVIATCVVAVCVRFFGQKS